MFAVSKPLRIDIKKNFNFLILYKPIHLIDTPQPEGVRIPDSVRQLTR
jgi:hypothetical protein